MTTIDIEFNVFSDTPAGKDPDSYSPTLRKYHQKLWSKLLPNGKLFIHVPDTSDIRKDLKEVGFLLERDVLRSRVADESQMVKDFSDECRFWIARKPEPKF